MIYDSLENINRYVDSHGDSIFLSTGLVDTTSMIWGSGAIR